MVRHVRTLPALLLLLLLPAPGALGQQTLYSHLREIEGYRFEVTEKIPGAEEHQLPGLFRREVLKEWVLQNFIRGNLVPAGQPASPRIAVQAYEMLDHQGAFGAFSAFHAAEGGELVPVLREDGVDALVSAGRLVFWRGRFFLVLSGAPQASLTRAARALAEAIRARNLYPSSVSQLPEANRVEGSIRYYLGKDSLQSSPVFPTSMIGTIGFDRGVEVASASYHPHGNPLFLLAYPTPALADRYLPVIAKKLEDLDLSYGIQVKKTGVLICLFFGSPEEGQRILASVHYEPKIQWLYQKPPSPEEVQKERREVAGFLGVVVYTLIFSGVALLLLILGGMLFGTVRYQLLRKVPGFRRRSDMIRLNLDELDEKNDG